MDWWESAIIGVVSGVVSSSIFFVVMSCIKPRIKVSKLICRSVENSKVIYRIKVVNLTRAMLTHLQYSLFFYEDDGKMVSNVFKISPAKEMLTHIDAYKGNENYSDYAIRITYEFDEDKFPLNERTKLVFTIFAQHTFSNSVACVKRVYSSQNVEMGKFETGKSTKIIG